MLERLGDARRFSAHCVAVAHGQEAASQKIPFHTNGESLQKFSGHHFRSKAAAVFLVGFVLILQTMTADEVWLLRNDGFALRAFKRLEVHSNHDKWNILYTKMFYKWHFCVYSIDSTFVFLFFFCIKLTSNILISGNANCILICSILI